MKITVKTVRKQEDQYEVDDDATVLQLKEKIAEKIECSDVSLVNLVCAGKQLKDADKLSESGVKDGSVVILFVRKAAASAPTVTTITPATAPPPKPTESTPSTQTQQPPSTQRPPSTQPAQAPSVPQAEEEKVTQLVNMGYPKDQAEAALRAAFGDVNRAVEYLTNGIPDGVADLAVAPSAPQPSVPAPQPSAQSPPQPTEEREIDPAIFDNMTPEQLRAHAQASHDDGSAGIAGLPLGQTTQRPAAPAFRGVPPQLGTLLQQMRTAPQFEQIRQLIRSNPGAEEIILQQFAATIPNLAPILATYRTQIIDALRGNPAPRGGVKLLPDDLFNGKLPEIARQYGVTLTSGSGPLGSAPSGNAFGGDVQFFRQPNGSIAVSLSPEDKANVERIVSITGASPEEAIQTYLACEKNVEQAINLLMMDR